jgi:hypothetical protein
MKSPKSTRLCSGHYYTYLFCSPSKHTSAATFMNIRGRTCMSLRLDQDWVDGKEARGDYNVLQRRSAEGIAL